MSTETGKNARMTAEREALIDMAAGYLLSLSSEFDARTMTADEARAEVLAELARRTAAREIERLEADNARLEAEVERLKAEVGRPKAEGGRGTWRIPPVNWPAALADAIERAVDGDAIVVPDGDLGLIAPGKRLELVVAAQVT